MNVRDFIIDVRRCLASGQTCMIRIADLDDYEHLSFTLRRSTDLDRFSNVFDQDLLDADVYAWYEVDDEEGRTVFIKAAIEL